MTKYQKEIESLLFNYEKDLDKKLYKAYARSLREIKREIKPMMDNIDNLNYTQRQKLIKNVSLQLQIEQQMDYLNGYVTDNTYKFLNQTGEIAYNGLFYEFEQLEGFNTNFTMLPAKTIETIVQTPVEGLRFSERIMDGSVAKLRSNFEEVFRVGFTKGYSYQKMAQQLSDVSLSSYKRSMNIARTEGGRVQAVTRQMSQKDALELGIRTKKEWVSTLDGSTRDTHRKLDGQVREVDEYFEVNGHKALQPHLFGIASEDIHCRCRSILILDGYDNKLRRDNETKGVIKYKNYQEWKKAKQPVKPKKEVIADNLNKNNMKEVFGKANYNNFLKSYNSLPESDFKELLNKHVSEVDFKKSDGNFARGNKVNLNQEAFDGAAHKKAMQSVYHEISHAIDGLGAELFDSEYDRVSEMPKYQLKKHIQKDLLNTFNRNLREINGDSYVNVKSIKKLSIYDESAIVRKYKKLAEESPQTYSALSDMMESTGKFIDYPLGQGHGSKYWKSSGMQEAEFFAHMSETVVNEEARKMMYETFPTASKKWEQMIKDILGGS